MDNFTISVIFGDALVVVTLVVLLFMDKGKPASAPVEPAKPAGKRSA